MLPTGEVVYEIAGLMLVDRGGSSTFDTLKTEADAAVAGDPCESASYSSGSGTETLIRDSYGAADVYSLDSIQSAGDCDASSLTYSLVKVQSGSEVDVTTLPSDFSLS